MKIPERVTSRKVQFGPEPYGGMIIFPRSMDIDAITDSNDTCNWKYPLGGLSLVDYPKTSSAKGTVKRIYL